MKNPVIPIKKNWPKNVRTEAPFIAAPPISQPNPESASAPYTLEIKDDDTAEITLYGDIVSRRPTDWEGNPIQGRYIILDEVLADLDKVKNVSNLTVRIHSAGGNAYDSMAIYSRLKSHPATITMIVDGVAMSGGSLILCAGDTVRVHPGSLIMIHRCWLFLFGGYNADELRGLADSNDAVDRSQAAIYQAKTGKSEEELLEMMSKEFYMTGSEAVDHGFADEFMEDALLEIAASADRNKLYVGGLPVWAAREGQAIPNGINLPTISTAHADGKINNQPVPSGKEGGHKPMAKTVDELRKEYPDLVAQLETDVKASVTPPDSTAAVTAAVEAERVRMKEIDEIAPNVLDAEMIAAAKYGDKPCTAQELAFQALKAQAQQGTQHLEGFESDIKGSGAANVPATSVPPNGDPAPDSKEAIETQAKAAVEVYKNIKGGA